MTTVLNAPWWKTGVIYQVYPRSFMDANNDGIGDLQGIIGKLDYLQWLGIRALWISPIYPSPMADFGYDITDYTAIDAQFGTMADFDQLLQEAHRRELKVILDLAPNHTSDRHPWFNESKSSKNSPKRDWYIWHDGKADGSPPNNWKSVFGGDAWEWDGHTQQYYYHGFLKEQPDLNWWNPDVQEAMFDVMRFWLDKGVDGFRVDVIWHRMAYYGPQRNGVHMPFNFQLLTLPWHAHEIAATIDQYEGALPAEGWPNWVLSNHDRPRVASRVGEHQALVAAMLLLTLRGTPTVYYGDEIGMRDVAIPAEEQQDPKA